MPFGPGVQNLATKVGPLDAHAHLKGAYRFDEIFRFRLVLRVAPAPSPMIHHLCICHFLHVPMLGHHHHLLLLGGHHGRRWLY